MPIFEIHTFIPQIFWFLVCFGLLYFCLSKIFVPKFLKIFTEREVIISEAIEKAKAAQEEAQMLREDYQLKLTNSLKLREAKLAEATEKLSKELEEKYQKIDIDYTESLKQFEAKLTKFQEDNKNNIEQLSKETATILLNNLLKVNISEKQILEELKAIRQGTSK